MSWALKRGCGIALLFCSVTASRVAVAQEEPPSEQTELEALQDEIAEAEERLAEWRSKAAEYVQTLEAAPAELEVIEREIERLKQLKAIEVSDDVTADELEQRLDAADRDLASARAEKATLDAELSQRSERRRRLPELLEAARDRLRDLPKSPLPAAEGAPEVIAAQAELAQLRLEAAQAEIDAYEREVESYDSRGTLLSKRRERSVLEISHQEELTQTLHQALKVQQQRELEEDARQAQTMLKKLDGTSVAIRGLVESLAKDNQKLAERIIGDEGITRRIGDLSQKLSRAEKQISDVDAALTNLQEQIAAVGLVDTVGLMLRRQRANAPDVGMYRRFIRMRQPEIGSVQLEQIQLRQRRQDLVDIDATIAKITSNLEAGIPEGEQRELHEMLRELLQTQREYLDSLIDDYETYFEKLIDFDARQRQLVDSTERLNDFIDARVLWVPSGGVISGEIITDAGEATNWLLLRRHWEQLGRALSDVALRQIVVNVLIVLLLIALLILRPRIVRRIDALGKQAQSYRNTSFAPTAEALGLTFLLVPWWPGVLIYVGWQVIRSPVATLFARSLGSGLIAAGLFWLSVRLVRVLARPEGVAQAHCGWPKGATRSLRRDLGWLLAVAMPAVFLVFTFETRGEDAWTESFGRFVFLLMMVAIAAFTYVVVRPGGPLVAILGLRSLSRKRIRLWQVLRVAAVLAPVALALGAVRGFYWTALQLSFRLHLTLLFLVILFLAFRLAVRWSVLARRRVALEQADHVEEDVEEDAVDLDSVEAQTARLLKGSALLLGALGLVLIWADVFPAAGLLRDVELWSTTRAITETAPDALGVERTITEDRVVPITLADLLLALLIAGLTLALMRNLPGLLDVTLFRRLQAGERYAYKTLVRYAIALAGLALAFGAVGIGWSNIQWLVAAVGLGLGFGLQEIFANFVSGLIILFERPIRVGDIVTVGDVSGTVTKIRIRATWITGFDRKELVVPNKEFVTAQLINWSLSDPILRLEIPVGIAYGSDTQKAVRVLEEVAAANPRVLKKPAPLVLFLGFGDSSLSFELRSYVNDVLNFHIIRHELHMAVDAAFREAEIEIAFPQLDLHVRDVPKGAVTGPSG